MTPVIPSPTTTISLVPGAVFTARKNNCLTRCSIFPRSSQKTLTGQKYILPLTTPVKSFPAFGNGFGKVIVCRMSATGTDLAVEEPNSPVADNVSSGDLQTASDAVDVNTDTAAKSDSSANPSRSKRARPVRKSEMPPIKNEDLVPGATFTGKVKSIQPFGAFVDFGAFTDGLVHVSKLSDNFVRDVGSIVSVGQEVKVRLVEANRETGRISLTMRDSDDGNKPQQQKDVPISGDKNRPPKRSTSKANQKKDEVRKSSKFVKGQDLQGTVKNLTRAGAFISLPEGEEGFLPSAEESNEGFDNITGGSSLQAGQDVSVRVFRITRGQVTLTMKKEDAMEELDAKLRQGVVYTATNPFVLAFRRNKYIAAFLDEREKEVEPTEDAPGPESPEATEANIKQSETELDTLNLQDESVSNTDGLTSTLTVMDEEVEDNETSVTGAIDDSSIEILANDTVESIEEKPEVNSEVLPPEESMPTEAAPAIGAEKNDGDTDLPVVETNQLSSENLFGEEVTDAVPDEIIAKDEVLTQAPSVENNFASATAVEEEKSGLDPEKNGFVINNSSNELQEESRTGEIEASSEVVDGELDDTLTKDEIEIQTPAVESATTVENEKADSVAERSEQDAPPSLEENSTKAAISPALVKQLREESGAGMMDCKKALSETGGDIVKAQEVLRKKGLANADKKASRATAEGRIGSYIHDSRIGVLIEVNCETDFVSRGDIFKELVDDLAMQVAACPQVQYLDTEDVPGDIVDKEREIEIQKEDLQSKPEQIRNKIVEGRIRKRLEDLALLEQPYIKNDKVVVKDLVKQTIATIGENIKVKRFMRYNLGEGLEKRSQNFAAEVAAQTEAKPESAPGKEHSTEVETKVVEKPAKAAVSAALVKQLREETGAGMMDCKKALSETGGDLEKAQEYLRKKGLSAADKKSSRLAAEGRIGSYIHDSRIGVLIEVNCETDFVGRSEKFKELVDDLAMQVAACPQVLYVSTEDIPESIVNKEKELEMGREDLQSKPENIREKIVEGRVSKRLGELALLEQPFIRDDSILVKDFVKQTIAALGENIKVRRFVRFTLGES